MASAADLLDEAGNPILAEDGTRIQIEWSAGTAEVSVSALLAGSVAPVPVASVATSAPAIAGVSSRQSIAVASVDVPALTAASILSVQVASVAITAPTIGAFPPISVSSVTTSAPAIASFNIIPAVPTGFEAKRTSAHAATDLSWDAITNASTYVIYRAEDHRSEYSQHATVSDPATTYTDSHGSADQNYSYKIAAKTSAGVLSRRSRARHTGGLDSERKATT